MAKEIGTIEDAQWADGVRLPVVLTFEHQSGEGTPLLPGDRPNYMMGGALEYGGRTGIWNILELLPGDALSGVVLIVCAAVAMGIANSALGPGYFGLLHATLEFGPIAMPVLHWINDLLMAVFFLVVGMEIKRELRQGELADPRRAALPIAGALGGMIVPALIYAAFNHDGPAEIGRASCRERVFITV